MFLKLNSQNSLSFDRAVRNIGTVDLLGNFCLDHRIKQHFDIPVTGFWDRLKQEYSNRIEEEVRSETLRIIQEIYQEVVRNKTENEVPKCIILFLSFTSVKS